MLKITVINCDGRYINYEWNSKREFVLDIESSNEHIPMLDDKLIEINGKSNKNYNIVDDLYKECKEEQQMGLKKYIVTYYEAYSKGYEVEAANKEEAENICAAESDGCDVVDYMDSQYDSELVEDEEDLEGIVYDEL